MDIYVYVDDVPYTGDDAEIQIVLPMTDEYFIGDIDGELGSVDIYGERRLNIYVAKGFNNGNFSQEIMQQLRLWYNLSHDGIGDVYLIWGGNKLTITDLIRACQ